MNPWRTALNWHLGVLLFGSLAATVLVFIPFIAVLLAIYGSAGPGETPALWYALRIAQILQSLVIGLAGGYLTLRYFRRRFSIAYEDMRRQLRVIGFGTMGLLVLLSMIIALLRYGPTPAMLSTSVVIFGAFVVCFLMGSFHFARKLAGQPSTVARDAPATRISP
jgi:ethanolamine transporter EutH